MVIGFEAILEMIVPTPTGAIKMNLPKIEEDLSGSVDNDGWGHNPAVHPHQEQQDHQQGAQREDGVQPHGLQEGHLHKITNYHEQNNHFYLD